MAIVHLIESWNIDLEGIVTCCLTILRELSILLYIYIYIIKSIYYIYLEPVAILLLGVLTW